MEHYSILDAGTQGTTAALIIPPSDVESDRLSAIPLVAFPVVKEQREESLNEIAERDLRITLQLLVERAQFITGSTAASIALLQDGAMICRARLGQAAPEVGVALEIQSGLSAECIRTRQTLRCENAETDLRVNQESCRALGIVSVMVMPIVQEPGVTGLFELLSTRLNAFEERDVVALQRLGEMVQTAVEQADAIKRSIHEIATKDLPQPTQKLKVELAKTEEAPAPAEVRAELPIQDSQTGTQTIKTINVRTCVGCGFPVSEGRKLCLDCESAAENQNPTSAHPPAWISESANRKQPSWLRANIYAIGTILMIGITIAIFLLKRPF